MAEVERDATAGGRPDGSERPALGADLIIPALAVAFTTYYLIDTAPLVWEAKANGVIVGIALYVLIGLQVYRIARRVLAGEATLGLGDIVAFTTPQKQRIALVVITALFILALPFAGISISLFATMLACMWVLGERNWRTLLGWSFGTTATVYVLFIAFLNTRLPTGPVEHLITRLIGGA
ncbi:tripartite tricarboxylate transporter TctB family protein [Marinivivus vitaminiproducens]|uniref:tripartite tricarboxylate transporter TctB family protein n=1 Tax=Marinivivus vitaminiproducens TaxID=3035935 RepID=UPI0027A82A7D|nr:tripartite tricarboxylate transporter TctB family protein [Geminicoccaceae bacterium SCSIO 64248]